MIEGSLDRLHFGDLLQWFQMGGVSGRLTMTNPRGDRRLDFREGRVCYVSSTVPQERLASWLAARDLVSRGELRRLLALSMVRRTLFSDLLTDEGGVDPSDLREGLTDLAEAITGRILLSPEVTFEFDPEHPVLDVLGLNLNVEPSHLLLEAARRSDEDDLPEYFGDAAALPLTGDAFENLFWELIRGGVSADDGLQGEQLSALHELVRDIVGTLSHWLESNPGLVPMPVDQVSKFRTAGAGGESVYLPGLPHAVWNQMVFARSVCNRENHGPQTLAEIEESAAVLDLWQDLAEASFLSRPDAGKLDELIRHVATIWSRSAAAAAPHLGVDPGMAALAVHLLMVPTDLVLWVLTTLPLPHQNLRKALLQHLPRRLGCRLGRFADFPPVVCEILDPKRVTPLGVCLHLARECLPSAGTWLRTIPADDASALEIASTNVLMLAADAAREVADEYDAPIFDGG